MLTVPGVPRQWRKSISPRQFTCMLIVVSFLVSAFAILVYRVFRQTEKDQAEAIPDPILSTDPYHWYIDNKILTNCSSPR